MKEQIRNKWIVYACLFVLELMCIVIFQYKAGTSYIDSDMSGLMVYAQQLNQEHAIVSENWYYSTEISYLDECHLYKITAETTSDIAAANITLSIDTDADTNDNWRYAVYKGSTSSITTVVQTAGTMPETDYDMHSGAALDDETPAEYYLLVYLHNVSASQNDGVTENTTDDTGTYNGTVTLTAAGGQVKATFTA